MIETKSDDPLRATIAAVTEPAHYYAGRYLQTICPRCRHEHHALKTLEEIPSGTFFNRDGRLVLHEYHSDVPLFCQLCGVDISGRTPVDTLFGQPWHIIRDHLPASLVTEMDAWIASRERDEHPPNGLIQRLYDAYLKAKIEIFPR